MEATCKRSLSFSIPSSSSVLENVSSKKSFHCELLGLCLKEEEDEDDTVEVDVEF